jgi:putative intracellular protease/amidase
MSACAATKCFYEWGLPADIKVTCYPGIQTGKFVSQYVNKTVSISKNFITTQGPGTIIEFSFEVVKKFVSPAIAKKVKTQMLIK